MYRLRRVGTTIQPFVSLARPLSLVLSRTGSPHLTSPTRGEGTMYRLRRIPPSPNLSHQGRGNDVSAAPNPPLT
jgi:hypothetical protein